MEDAPLHLYYGDVNKVRDTVSLKYHNVDKVDLYKFKTDNIGGSVTMKCVHNHNRSQVSQHVHHYPWVWVSPFNAPASGYTWVQR